MITDKLDKRASEQYITKRSDDGCQHAVEEVFSEVSSVELETELVQITLEIFRLHVVEDIEYCSLCIADLDMHPRKNLSNLFFRNHLRVMFFEHFVKVGVGRRVVGYDS